MAALGEHGRCDVKHPWIALFAMLVVAGSTGEVGAQYEYGPEEVGTEESPFVDPDTASGNESSAEVEEVEEIDAVKPEAEVAAPEGKRKGRNCAASASSSTQSGGPIGVFLFGLGVLAFRSRRKKQ